jgi:site-specific recombinase XerD
MAWLRSLITKPNGGRRQKLTEESKERVWGLAKRYENKSLVAEALGVSRRTIIRFLKCFPIPETFAIEQNVQDYSEIQTWLKRQKAFSKQSVIDGYMGYLQKMHNYMKEHHPERTRPKLWTSDDILEFVQTFQPYQQHNAIVALRQLAKKCTQEFPFIDLGLLPTKKTHKAKRSLAGKEEYYLDIAQIVSMIENVPYKDEITKARNKCIIALPFNIACRTGDAKEGRGLLGIRIENMDLDNHRLRILDKGDVWWNVQGLGDDTVQLLHDYLKLRGYPKEGFLFVNGNGEPMTADHVNDVWKQAGKNAGIEGKVFLEKVARKSLVKHFLEVLEQNPVCLVGTGKNPKTCLCVGWSDMKILMEHYAPKLTKQIEKARQTFLFRKDIAEVLKKQKAENLQKTLAEKGINIDEGQIGTLLAVIEALA